MVFSGGVDSKIIQFRQITSKVDTRMNCCNFLTIIQPIRFNLPILKYLVGIYIQLFQFRLLNKSVKLKDKTEK